MAGREKLGHIVDALNCGHDPDDGELIVSALILIKVIRADGRESIRMAPSEGMGFIERIGMLRIAGLVEEGSISDPDD